jgi:D-alanine-D-alanine ligase
VPTSKIRNRRSKITVGVLFGGRSAEHEVSLVSAAAIINGLDKRKYNVIPIGITPEGKWLSTPDAITVLKARTRLNSSAERILLPDPALQGLVALHAGSRAPGPRTSLDLLFPVLHGTFGEDGTVQGLFELADIPYVGAGVLGSAIGMDKVVTKQLCEHARIPVTPYVWFSQSQFAKHSMELMSRIEKTFGYPVFVKPANLGSSVGITKAHNRRELKAAVVLASQYDTKILVEKAVRDPREIEVSVIGNDRPVASIPGEVVSSNEFYDYDAKYVDGKSTAIIPARLSPTLTKRIQDYAVRSFAAIDCSGMARVDFLLSKSTGRVYFSEINTIPGFTSISMFPKLWEASGLAFSKLLDRLIELALERHAHRSNLHTTFKPKSKWYK